MNQHPMHGVVNERSSQVSQEVVKGFQSHNVATICDVMGGVGIMTHSIKPLQPGMRFCGPAVTVLTRPGDALFPFKATDSVERGDVLVIDASGYTEAAVAGEIYASYLKDKGVAGLVIDGSIRDSLDIVALEFPTFVRATCAALFDISGPGAINVRIQCGGVSVNPGDIVVGDADGVVVVPEESAAQILKLADQHEQAEATWTEELKTGKTLVDLHNLNSRVAKWQSQKGLEQMQESPNDGAHRATKSFAKQSLTSAFASELLIAAERKAHEIGQSSVIAVVDESGVLKAFSRMDNAPLLSVQVAQDKAYTAAGFGMSTDQWYEFIENDAPLRIGAPSGIDRLVIFGGGYPLVVDDKIVGGIGVSGGHYSEDMEVAKAACEILGGQ